MKPLNDWLVFLESLNPNKIKLGLERVRLIAEKLQLTQFTCPVITVTGTNGKGSCVIIMESIFLAGGYRVGAYISPHIFRFNERLRINAKAIDDEALCQAFEKIDKAREGIELTYFEFTTLAALSICQQSQLDVLILEIGIGGRLDAVNIIDADIAVISTIDIDHTEWLGNDRESIGREKAGIFRPHKVAVCGDNDPPHSIYKEAQNLNTELYVAGKAFYYIECAEKWDWISPNFQWKHLPKPKLELQNAATSLMVVHLLSPRLPVSQTAVALGLQQAHLPGRWQRQGQCIFDVGHNPHAAQGLAKKLQTEPCKGKTFAVVGMLADKNIPGTLEPLINKVDYWYAGGLPGPRGASSQQLKQILSNLNAKKCYNYTTIKEAYQTAREVMGVDDRVLIFGSFLTVAACMEAAAEIF